MQAKTISLNYYPRVWQQQCHVNRKRFTVLALHRRAGKTKWAIMELVDKALRFPQDLGLFFYVCPELKQAKTVAWDMLKASVAPLVPFGQVEISESNLAVRFPHNNASIRLYGGDNPDAMRGVRLDGCVLDEVAQMKPEVWDEIIRPALADRKGWAVFIGTPKGVNLFSKLFYEAQEKPDWHSARYTVYDTQALDPSEVEAMRADQAEDKFAREMLCDFTAAGDDQLLSLADCENAARRLYKSPDYDFAPRILGVDPARFGDDRSVIAARQGLVAFPPVAYQGIDNMELAVRVANKIVEWQPDAVFIDAGAGAGVIDRLRQLEFDQVIEVDFGGRAADPRFVNKRAEMWYSLRDWVLAGGAIPNSNELKLELATPNYSYDAANRIKLESKDDIKKRIDGRSPDLADALALTFAMPVAARSRERLFTLTAKPMREYDPYAHISTRTLDDSTAEYSPYANIR